MCHRIAAAAAAIAALLLLGLNAAIPAAAQVVDTTPVTPESVKWNPAPFPGISTGIRRRAASIPFREVCARREGTPHTHPDQRVVTVMSGIIHVGMGSDFLELAASSSSPPRPWVKARATMSHRVTRRGGRRLSNDNGVP